MPVISRDSPGGLTIVALGLLAEPREEGLAARVSVRGSFAGHPHAGSLLLTLQLTHPVSRFLISWKSAGEGVAEQQQCDRHGSAEPRGARHGGGAWLQRTSELIVNVVDVGQEVDRVRGSAGNDVECGCGRRGGC